MENKKTILITGIAGFIGFHLASKLNGKYKIIGLDNLNDYYDVSLKYGRLANLNFNVKEINKGFSHLNLDKSIKFYYSDLNNKEALNLIFKENKIDIVINLAAQAGIRFSLEEPDQYIDSNVIGFYNLLEVLKENNIKYLMYASSSSVYGEQKEIEFKETFASNNQISLYAATKKINEILAKTYSNLFQIKTVGLRFFTVYGSFGRPDMAYFKFSTKLKNKHPIELYNYGIQKRDFTHISDIVKGIELILENIEENFVKDIYNIGSGNPIELKQLVNLLEKNFNKKFSIIPLKNQIGDVKHTYADIYSITKDFNFKPKMSFDNGIKEFCDWYKSYSNVG